ncbi:MAG: hypothetical protein SNJ70_00610 [Armatimonadota bacterium]
MIDLKKIATKLEDEEKLILKYKFPITDAKGNVVIEEREDRLLDVAEDAGILYVSHKNEVLWVKLDEVIEVIEEK